MSEEIRTRKVKLLGDHDPLQARLDRYRSLFEQAPVAYLVTDRLGVVSDATGARPSCSAPSGGS
jgi:hypothetical protein